MIPAEDPRHARLTDYVDGHLPEDERRAVEAWLDADEGLRREVEQAREARVILRSVRDVPRPPPPRDFLRKVQRRVRRSTGGRYFNPTRDLLGVKISVEVFAVIAVAVMAACYFFVDPGGGAPPERLEEVPGVAAPADPPTAPGPGGR